MMKVKLRTEIMGERMNRTILTSNKIWNQYDYHHLRDLNKAEWDMKYWKGMGVTVAPVLLALFKWQEKRTNTQQSETTTEQHQTD